MHKCGRVCYLGSNFGNSAWSYLLKRHKGTKTKTRRTKKTTKQYKTWACVTVHNIFLIVADQLENVHATSFLLNMVNATNFKTDP